MLLRVSRITFWLAALATGVALAIPTGWETGLTSFAALASALTTQLALGQAQLSTTGRARSAGPAPGGRARRWRALG